MPEGKANKAVIQTLAGMPNWRRELGADVR
jgi:hypothetical protein